MRKITDQMSMELNGGHTVVAYPRNGKHNELEASQPGTAAWQRECPTKPVHTTFHTYEGLTYDPRLGGTGRVYRCQLKVCRST